MSELYQPEIILTMSLNFLFRIQYPFRIFGPSGKKLKSGNENHVDQNIVAFAMLRSKVRDGQNCHFEFA